MNNICVVTGTRAEYGLLRPLMKKIDKAEDLALKIVVTGMHLSPEFGLTYHEIEEDGFCIDERIEMLLSADTNGSILKSMGVEIIGFADYFSRNQIDMIILLGDRYEIFVAATAALFYGIPIAHIHGGETTEGAIDEALRHSITKMSNLHFASTEAYRRRIVQLGEQPDCVYNVGSLGIENIKNLPLLEKKEVEEYLGLEMDCPVIMVTFHPVTLEDFTAKQQMDNLLCALDVFDDCKLIFTKSNSDAGGRVINQLIDKYVITHPERCVAVTSMGQKRYFSTLKYCAMAVGNSSSGIIEVPSFHIPTVNIGDRQRGRICAESVIQSGNETKDIICAIRQAFHMKENMKNTDNPYEREETVETIINTIRWHLKKGIKRKKHFYDML